MRLPDNVFATLKSVRAKYPTDRPLTPEEMGAILNETAWAHRAEGAGLQRKDSGTNCPQPFTLIPVWRGFRIGDKGFDVCGACTVGRFDPVQADSGPADMASFVPPVDPSGGQEPEPPDVTLTERVQALEQHVDALVSGMSGLVASVQALNARVTALEETPPSGGVSEVRVAEMIADALAVSERFDPAKWKARTRVSFLGTFDGNIERK